jgi:hypothetical protein
MSEVVIEPAVFEDLDELSNLLGEHFSEEKDFRPNKQKQLQAGCSSCGATGRSWG